MKKKNLVILLLIPFIISLLGIVTINVTFNFIETDIVAIKWDYDDVEGFQIREEPYKLTASGEKLAGAVLAYGNELTWKVENKDSSIVEPIAEIANENGEYYLVPLKEGEVLVTCSNVKGSVFKTMTAIIYKTGAIIVNPKIRSSQNNIDSTVYYGEYDLNNNVKQKAIIDYDIQVLPVSYESRLQVIDSSSNVTMNVASKQAHINNDGKAFFTLSVADEMIKDVTISFDIIKDGINVYSYEDLLYCTNKSTTGEIVVLRKSFESLTNVAIAASNNTVAFGNYDATNKKYNFANEVYSFTTTFNHEYISQWNEFAANNNNYKPISDKVYAGLRVQKDFYGNGYTINFHNLAYPYSIVNVEGSDGKIYETPQLSVDNLFRGPLPFYTLGDPNGMPIITAFGQDNVGMYIDGNNITINDVNIKNCDLTNSLTYLDYVGNVVDVHGDYVTIKNSRLSNGKNVLRSFSSNNLSIDNCMLSNSRNFLITTGSNEYLKINGSTKYSFVDQQGNQINSTLQDFISKKSQGDSILESYIYGEFEDKTKMKNAIMAIDKAVNDPTGVKDIYKGSMRINDSLFYRSGISSIALETYFNGPYLYSNAPSLIGGMFSLIQYEDTPLVPLEPKDVSGISYPVLVDISGDTRFYDYKDISLLDLTGLISENISTIANSAMGQDIRKITIDDIFPIKPMLKSQASSKKCVYTDSETSKQYFNVAIAYYGGGLNLSKVTYDYFDYKDNYLSEPLPINLLDSYLNLPAVEQSNYIQFMKNLMLKTVTVVIGCEPFKFVCAYNNNEVFEQTFNKTPTIDILKENAKGE